MQVTQAIHTFLAHCQAERGLDTKTLEAYRCDLRQFCSFLQEKNIANITNVTKNEIKDYAGSLTKLSLSSRQRKIAVLKTFFRYHELEEHISANPVLKVKLSVKPPKILPQTITLSQVNNMLIAAYKEKQKFKKQPTRYHSYKQAVRDIAVLELLFATGIRITELCTLTVANVSADFDFITIGGKSCRNRKIPISNPTVRAALAAYYKYFKQDIKKTFFINHWQGKFSEQSIRYMIARYARMANITQRITPSVLRHTFASLLVENDVSIQVVQHILGHSSVSVTQVYANMNNKKDFEILQTKNPRNLLKIT